MRLVNQLLITGLILIAIACQKQEKKSSQQLKIAYNVAVDMEKDNYEVFVMNFDGSGKHNVTNSPGVEWTYFAYQDKLYYISDRDTTHRYYYLYECDWQGNNLRKITNFRLADSWHNSRFNNTEMIVKPYKT
ncbi:MAG: hypothetical protein KDD94_05785, partial [Calditrichaeota bacterium]|nr:hypothetical protein [Calditrichota bacterium]